MNSKRVSQLALLSLFILNANCAMKQSQSQEQSHVHYGYPYKKKPLPEQKKKSHSIFRDTGDNKKLSKDGQLVGAKLSPEKKMTNDPKGIMNPKKVEPLKNKDKKFLDKSAKLKADPKLKTQGKIDPKAIAKVEPKAPLKSDPIIGDSSNMTDKEIVADKEIYKNKAK